MSPLLRVRSLRVGCSAVLLVVTAFALAVLTPRLLLAVTPLVFGVPHLLSDIRYLVVRQGLHRRPEILGALAAPVIFAVLDGRPSLGLCAIGAITLVARTALGTRLLAFVAFATLAFATYALSHLADIAVAHIHNLVALLFLLRWSRAPRALIPALACFVAAALVLFSGALDGWLIRGLLLPSSLDSRDLHVLARSLTWTGNADLSLRIIAFFAMSQAVHYGIWLRLIPEEDRTRRAPRSFAASYRALVGDVGGRMALGVLVVTACLLVYGFLDSTSARSSYFRLALFHGPLELAILVLLSLEARGFDREDSAPLASVPQSGWRHR